MKESDIKIVDAPAGLDEWGALPRALRAAVGTGKKVRVLRKEKISGGYHTVFAAQGFRLRTRTKGEFRYCWLEPREKEKK